MGSAKADMGNKDLRISYFKESFGNVAASLLPVHGIILLTFYIDVPIYEPAYHPFFPPCKERVLSYLHGYWINTTDLFSGPLTTEPLIDAVTSSGFSFSIEFVCHVFLANICLTSRTVHLFGPIN